MDKKTIYRVFWINYDNRPMMINAAGLEKFDLEEKAIDYGCEIIMNQNCKICCGTTDDEINEMVNDWKKYKYIHNQSKWHGLKIKLYNDDSYVEVFQNYFCQNNNCY